MFDEQAAKNEMPVRAEEVLAEIFPLLKDYFVGEIALVDGSISYKLPNGQKFILSVKAA